MLWIRFWILDKNKQTTLYWNLSSWTSFFVLAFIWRNLFFFFFVLLFMSFPLLSFPPCRLWELLVPTHSDAALFRAYDDLPVGSAAKCGSLISTGIAVFTGSLTVQNQMVLKLFVLEERNVRPAILHRMTRNHRFPPGGWRASWASERCLKQCGGCNTVKHEGRMTEDVTKGSTRVHLMTMLLCLQSEASGGVSGSEGKHQGEARWLRLPPSLPEVPQQVSHRERDFWLDSVHVSGADGCDLQVRHPDQRVMADVARRRETRRPSSPALRQHGSRSVPARKNQDLH